MVMQERKRTKPITIPATTSGDTRRDASPPDSLSLRQSGYSPWLWLELTAGGQRDRGQVWVFVFLCFDMCEHVLYVQKNREQIITKALFPSISLVASVIFAFQWPRQPFLTVLFFLITLLFRYSVQWTCTTNLESTPKNWRFVLPSCVFKNDSILAFCFHSWCGLVCLQCLLNAAVCPCEGFWVALCLKCAKQINLPKLAHRSDTKRWSYNAAAR